MRLCTRVLRLRNHRCSVWSRCMARTYPTLPEFFDFDTFTVPVAASTYRTLWDQMKACGELFCGYDDYNWDWTLLHLSAKKCFRSNSRPGSAALQTLLLQEPRVFHFGKCGVHATSGNCDVTKEAAALQRELAERLVSAARSSCKDAMPAAPAWTRVSVWSSTSRCAARLER